MRLPHNHSLRYQLSNEIHARPPAEVAAPERVAVADETLRLERRTDGGAEAFGQLHDRRHLAPATRSHDDHGPTGGPHHDDRTFQVVGRRQRRS